MIEPTPAGLDVEQLIQRVREEVARRQPEAVSMLTPTQRQWRYTLGELLRQDDLEFVTQVYRGVLHREPEHDDLRDCLSRLRHGECSQIDMLQELRFSPEGEQIGVVIPGLSPPSGPWSITPPSFAPPVELPIRERYALSELLQYRDEAFVRNAYRALLHREPDSGGLAHHLEKLRSGATRLDLILGLWLGSEGRTIAVELTGWSDFVQGAHGSAP